MLSADQLYDRLETEYGEPGWWSDDPFTVMFQSVLVQNTAWTSVVRTCGHIGGISPERITSMSREELEDLIRPCGFARSKSAARASSSTHTPAGSWAGSAAIRTMAQSENTSNRGWDMTPCASAACTD